MFWAACSEVLRELASPCQDLTAILLVLAVLRAAFHAR